MISTIVLMCCVVMCAGGTFEDECGLEATPTTPLLARKQEVGPTEFPWQVAIFRENGTQFDYKCGGSIVRSKLVITAAHCFSDKPFNNLVNADEYRVVGGSLLSSWSARTPGKQSKRVHAVRLGERYGGKGRNLQDDIALILLVNEFTFSSVVRAVCLDLVDRELHDTQTSPGCMGKVAGWGITDSGEKSKSLHFLRVPVVGDAECLQKMRKDYYLNTFITSDKICAGLINGSAVCKGYSGSGLVFLNTHDSSPRWYLHAVLSNGPQPYYTNTCRFDVLPLYTNIFKHRMWLYNVMEELQPREDCRLKGSAGVCREFSSCPRAMEESARGILPQYCSPSGTKVCCVGSVESAETTVVTHRTTGSTCPPLPSTVVSLRNTGSKANDYCVALAERLYPCQQNGSSWSRGDLCKPEPNKRTTYYWLVPLGKARPSDIQRYTSMSPTGMGSLGIPVYLVNDRSLLTRASDWNFLLTLPGANIGTRAEARFSISRIVHHLQNLSNNTLGTNDIVLLKMNRNRRGPITGFNLPVCLHTPQDSAGGLVLYRRVDKNPVALFSQEDCRILFPAGSMGAPGGVTDGHMCVASSTGGCAYLFNYLTANNSHRVACTQLLVGLMVCYKEEGNVCVELHIRVAHYTPWLETVIWP